MKLGEIVQTIHIDPRKLTEYALNPDHPHGLHKAWLFNKILGYTKENYQILKNQIEARALSSETIAGKADQRGQRYTVDIVIKGIEGQNAVVRTGWLVAPDSNEARLTTLFVRKRT
jgi:hypothetical protein